VNLLVGRSGVLTPAIFANFNAADFATPQLDLGEFECDRVFDRVTGPIR
jgi:hypothetical protein